MTKSSLRPLKISDLKKLPAIYYKGEYYGLLLNKTSVEGAWEIRVQGGIKLFFDTEIDLYEVDDNSPSIKLIGKSILKDVNSKRKIRGILTIDIIIDGWAYASSHSFNHVWKFKFENAILIPGDKFGRIQEPKGLKKLSSLELENYLNVKVKTFL